MKKIILLIFLIVASALFYLNIKNNISYNYKEPDIKQMIKAKTQNHYLDKEIKKAIESKNFDDVDSYLNLAKEFNITLLPQTKKLIAKENTTSKKVLRGAKNFINGFISGEANNSTQVAGAITSDFTLYGDLRDITIEGKKYIEHKPYDKLILGLSMAGVALSATTLISFGSSSALKVGTSSLKLAKKEKLLTKNFSKILSNKLDKSIDFRALKSININSISNIKKSLKIVKNSVNLKPLKPIFKNIHTIKNSTSLSDTIALMKYIDNQKDLQKVAKISKKYKKATRGIFKLFGKNIFRLVKAGIKWTLPLIISVLGFILSIFGIFIIILSPK